VLAAPGVATPVSAGEDTEDESVDDTVEQGDDATPESTEAAPCDASSGGAAVDAAGASASSTSSFSSMESRVSGSTIWWASDGTSVSESAAKEKEIVESSLFSAGKCNQ